MYYPKSPTDKQIAYADAIARTLNIDFPQSSRDFTRAKYGVFISAHVDEYKEQIRCDDLSDDDEMAWFQMLNG